MRALEEGRGRLKVRGLEGRGEAQEELCLEREKWNPRFVQVLEGTERSTESWQDTEGRWESWDNTRGNWEKG